MKHHRLILPGLIVCAALCAAPLHGEDKPANAGEAPAMVVDGETISYRALLREFCYMYPHESAQTLDTLILEIAVRVRAQAASVTVPDELLEQRVKVTLEKLEKSIQETAPDVTLDQYLQMQNKPRDQFERELRDKLHDQLQAEFLLAPQLLADDRMKVSMILTSTREQAEEARKKIQDGAEFSVIAEQYSLDQESRLRGGLLGTLPKRLVSFYNGAESLVPLVESATGDGLSEVVPVDRRFAVFRISDFQKALALSGDELKAAVLKMIESLDVSDLEMNLYLEKLRAEVKVEQFFRDATEEKPK